MKRHSLQVSALFNVLRTILNVIFPLITFPYITRVLSPDGVGKLDFSRSIVNYFVLISALGITQYAVREGSAIRDNTTKFKVFVDEIFSLNIITTLISYALLFITLLIVTSLHQYSMLILIFSLQIFLNTISVEWLYNIYENFVYITIRSFIVQVISIICMFLFVKTSSDYITYAWITTLSMGGAYIFNLFHAMKYVPIRITFTKGILRHLKSIMVLFFNNVATTIYLNSDVTIIGFIAGDYYVGIYSTAVKIYTIVKQVTNALLMSMLPRLSNYFNNDNSKDYQNLLNNIFWAMLMVISPSITGLIVLRKYIVEIIAGSEFARSSVSLSILAIGLLASVMSAFVIHGVLLVQRQENTILKITMVSAIVNIVLNIITVPFLKEIGAAISTVISEVIVLTMGLYSSRHRFKVKVFLNRIFAILLGCFMIVICCYLLKIFIVGKYLYIITSIVGSVILYGLSLLVFKAVPKLR
ncbi:flippase [Lactobacillus sp. YT155]|uniref:flippase n=1 Tax=Lactobacillus sp. YT155 TaxID=3060955 RepID=UPI00265D8A8D|nr:flippase [Lactobacillus sp. YT155]MDO1605233.1 flippase [Lactobacillus sp. YT155]